VTQQNRFRRCQRGRSQGGYILLTLMLFVALLAIAALAIAPSFTFQIKRDREEEMIHRGVQYSRAVRKYFKKFGRYPTRIEDLENTNNIRFLRRRYKDPINGQDFKLLHFGEVQLGMGAGIAGATSAAAMAGSSAPGAGAGGAFGGNTANGASGFSLGPTTTPASGQPQAGSGTASADASTDSSSSSSQSAGVAGGNQIVASGPIIGVVSASKAATIREFNKEDHYNQWKFIYDPATDFNRGGLINTPAQPPLQNAVANNGQPAGTMGAVPGQGGMGTSFGSSGNSFGAGMSNGISGGAMGSQPPPQNPPPTQPQQ